MCIAIIKPIGVNIPSKEILKNCWINNEHGAGFGVYTFNQYHVKKGFMKFKTLYKALQDVESSKDKLMFIHFRISTSGGRGKEKTHPFPLSDNIDHLNCISYKANSIMMHNGILGKGCDKRQLSDTQLFVIEYLFPLRRYLNDPDVISVLENIAIGSKIAIGLKHGEYKTIGEWITIDGCLYSNRTYQPSVKAWTFPSTYKAYAWDDEKRILWDDEFNIPYGYKTMNSKDSGKNTFLLDDYKYFSKRKGSK